MKKLLIALGLIVSVSSIAWAAKKEAQIDAAPTLDAQKTLEVSANEWGLVPILEYHNIGPQEARWTRSYENFKKDLEWLFNNDYVLFSIDNFITGHYDIPAGKKPVILTFDDGSRMQFKYSDDGSIDPNSAVGMLDAFYQDHPSFGRAAAFYVNATPFGNKAEVAQKLSYLTETGRSIGYHTLNHTQLKGLSPAVVGAILEKQRSELKKLLPEIPVSKSLAYPHGGVPTGDLKELGEWIEIGLLVGAEPAYPLHHPSATPYRLPRIQAIDSEWLRHFGRQTGATEKQEKSERFDAFVSDGNALEFSGQPGE